MRALAAGLASRESLTASTFLKRVADGDGVASTHPVGQLRRRITQLRVRGGRINETEGLALTIQTWNTVRASRSTLRMPKGALTNDNFPEPR